MAHGNVAGQRSVVEILKIGARVCHLAHFGETADGKVVGEQGGDLGALARGKGGAGGHFMAPGAQILAERVGIRFVQAVPSRKVRRQFAAEQVGVAARQHHAVPLPLEAVH